jgi:hypothetical protein
MNHVYLAGPITGCSYEEARLGWRRDFVILLRRLGGELTRSGQCTVPEIRCLSPMRRITEQRDDLDCLSALGDEKSVMASARGITAGDRLDVRRSDVVFVNLLGARRISAGTMIELGWADAWGKPVVAALEADGSNPHEHAMVQELVQFRVPTLEAGARVVAGLLSHGW